MPAADAPEPFALALAGAAPARFAGCLAAVGGHHLDRLAVSGGQFFFWRCAAVLISVFDGLIFCGSISQFGAEIGLPSLAAGSPFVDVAEARAHRVPV